MANTLIIQPRKFISRIWEHTHFWQKEIERNPRRAFGYEPEEPMTAEEIQAEYDYFESHDMVIPTTRSAISRFRWKLKRVDRLTKRVHADKFFRISFSKISH